MPRHSYLRDNGLSIVLFALFAIFTVGLALTGWQNHNAELVRHGRAAILLPSYLTGPDFGEAIFENWESEFLQMGLYVLLTAFLFQRGSSESKDPDQKPATEQVREGSPKLAKRQGLVGWLYRNSLSIAFAVLFIVSLIGHALCGHVAANEEAIQHGEKAQSLLSYVSGSQFWFESFQNWQSEFLAVFAIVVLSIWLRQEGSPESKGVGAPHSSTGG